MSKKKIFPKSKRLLKRFEFQEVLKRGARATTKNFIVYSFPSQYSWDRLGIIVSRKTGKTVIRNRIKRILREYFRKNNNSEFLPRDLVFICKKKRNYLDYESVAEEVRGVYKQGKPVFNKNISMASENVLSQSMWLFALMFGLCN